MMAAQVTITDRERQLREIAANPGRFGLSRCLLCSHPLFAVGAVEEGDAFIPYALCETHWGRFEDKTDPAIIGEIEAAMRRLVA
jgi:hypothetical protein